MTPEGYFCDEGSAPPKPTAVDSSLDWPNTIASAAAEASNLSSTVSDYVRLTEARE